MKRSISILMLAVALMMSGCKIVDPLAPCETIIDVRFDYRFSGLDGGGRPSPSEPSLADMVDNVQLYIFDENAGNILKYVVSVRHDNIVSGQLPIEILSGRYTMVAWGLSRNSLPGGGFAEVHMVDPATNYHTQTVIDKTTLEEFRLLVLQPEDPSFADLYHAEAVGVNVPIPTNETQIVNVDFNFVRYSNELRVTINGIQYLNESDTEIKTRAEGDKLPLDIYMTGKNGMYEHDGKIDRNASELRYNDLPVSYTEKQMVVDIKTLRIDTSRHETDPLVLHMHDVNALSYDAMHKLIPDLNLLSLIYQVKDASTGRYLFRTQDQIDAATQIPIDITITRKPNNQGEEGYEPGKGDFRLEVTITVAGWEIEDIGAIDVGVVM